MASHSQGPESQVHGIALTSPQLLTQFLRYLANGIVSPAPWVGELLVILLPLALLFGIFVAAARQASKQAPAGCSPSSLSRCCC